MKLFKAHIIFGSIALLMVISSCIEPFRTETFGFEGVLVVDARLTDEVKQHQILLSRARPFERDSITPESNASVSILEDSGTTYEFEETTPGHYKSTAVFGAKAGQRYQLKINTSDGDLYTSTSEIMPDKVPIADLELRRETNDLGEDGVAVILDNESLGQQPRYFRYDYEENYEIRAPNWDPFKFKIIDSIACTDGDAFEVIAIPKNSLKGRICYGRNLSKDIILTSTDNLKESSISDFEVRFVNRENYILMHRYSISVNQYTQSVDAHSYYKSLEAFSVSESVFSETQPGFLAGNIFSETDAEQSVIGYFETAAVSTWRLFVNYEDLFPNEELPEYPINCSRVSNPRLIPRGYHCTMGSSGVCDGNCESVLINLIQSKQIVFAGEKEPIDIISPFFTQPFGCGDCTKLGSSMKPDFWID